MDRDAGLRALGLGPGAGVAEIEHAYKLRSRSTKTLILEASRTDDKDRHRQELRELVRLRDLALGRPLRRSWEAERLGIGTGELVRTLRRTSPLKLDRPAARSFLRVGTDAGPDEVRTAFRQRDRVLVRAFANARDDRELASLRRARAKLRTIRNFAL